MNHRQPSPRETSTARQALADVRRIVCETLGGEGATVYLFGSWARGEATRLSDIDVAIDSPLPLSRGVLARLRERLEESHVPYHVDVVDLTKAMPELRRRVLAEGVLWSD